MTAIAGVPPPDIETSSEAYARRFAGSAGAYMLARQQALVEELLADKRAVSILDVGGGHAQLCGPLAAKGHQVTVLGSTPECATLVERDARNAAVRFVTGPLVPLPFPDASFDTVVSIRLMAHIADWPALIGEMCRVARRSVVIDYPVWASSNALSLLAFGLKKQIEGDTRTYRSFWGPEIAAELRRHGKGRIRYRRQFLLPMALHRKLGGGAALHAAEATFAATGLTRLLGNPAMLRADAR